MVKDNFLYLILDQKRKLKKTAIGTLVTNQRNQLHSKILHSSYEVT